MSMKSQGDANRDKTLELALVVPGMIDAAENGNIQGESSSRKPG